MEWGGRGYFKYYIKPTRPKNIWPQTIKSIQLGIADEVGKTYRNKMLLTSNLSKIKIKHNAQEK